MLNKKALIIGIYVVKKAVISRKGQRAMMKNGKMLVCIYLKFFLQSYFVNLQDDQA